MMGVPIRHLHAGKLNGKRERALFASLRMANGLFKTTETGRLCDINDAVNAIARKKGRPLNEVLDIGASSGITSLEWLESMRKAGFTPQLTATDLVLSARLVRLHGAYQVLVDRKGPALQHLLFGVPIRPWRRRLDYASQNWILITLLNRMFELARQSGAIERAMHAGEEIPLVVPRALADPAIRFEEDDVFAPNPPAHIGRFDAVRAANLLLLRMFDRAKLERAIANLRERLRGPGALLIVAGSDIGRFSSSNHATIFELGANGRLTVLERIGRGSEIEALVLASRPTSALDGKAQRAELTG